MSKTVPESKFQEWVGLDRISPVVHQMRCIYREITKDDFGIDGEIEIVTPKPTGQGYETTGSIIKVQAKSGKSYIKFDTHASFSASVSKDDLDLWYKANYPTIYVIYHPGDDKLYWKDVKSYIRASRNVWHPPFHIEFNKQQDEFTPACYENLRAIAQVDSPRISFQQKEKLYSNLLPVTELPELWSSPTKAETDEEIRFCSAFDLPPFFVSANRLYSLYDLTKPINPLANWIDAVDVTREHLPLIWQDQDLKRGYIETLNQLMRSHLAQCFVKYTEAYRRYYFIRENPQDLEFKHAWLNVRNNRAAPQRITVKYYKYGVDEFWRHLAVALNFKQFGEQWFLQIIPRYFFTTDGDFPFDNTKVGSYTTRIKAKEVNYHVLNHILFWSDVLSWPGPSPENRTKIIISLNNSPVMKIEKLPNSAIASFAIPDDPAEYREPDPSKQMSLIEWTDLDKKGEDDD
jgi:hypothetical protein